MASADRPSGGPPARYPPVSALPTHMTSGETPAHSEAKRRPVRPKPVAISSITSSRSCSSATAAQRAQVARVVDAHPASALDHRLDDDRRELVGVAAAKRLPLGQACASASHRSSRRADDGLGGRAAKTPGAPRGRPRVPSTGVADGHRREGVAVVAAASR